MEKKKVVLTCPEKMFTEDFISFLKIVYDFTPIECSIGESQLIETLKDTDILIMGGNEVITPQVLESIPNNLKFIFAGIEARTSFPETWENVKDKVFTTGGGQEAVVRTTMSQLTFFNPLRLQGLSARNHKIPLDRESILKNQTLLVVGAGTIGKKVMILAKEKFGKVIYTAGRGEKNELRDLGFEYVASLIEAFFLADAVSFHLELNPSTKNIIGSNNLRRIKKNGFILNNARAELVAASSLESLIFDRSDVFVIVDEFYVNGANFLEAINSPEPNTYQQLISFENFWYTGHTASVGEETRKAYSQEAYNILANLNK